MSKHKEKQKKQIRSGNERGKAKKCVWEMRRLQKRDRADRIKINWNKNRTI